MLLPKMNPYLASKGGCYKSSVTTVAHIHGVDQERFLLSFSVMNKSPEYYHGDYCDESPKSEEKLYYKISLVITGAYSCQMKSVVR